MLTDRLTGGSNRRVGIDILEIREFGWGVIFRDSLGYEGEFVGFADLDGTIGHQSVRATGWIQRNAAQEPSANHVFKVSWQMTVAASIYLNSFFQLRNSLVHH